MASRMKVENQVPKRPVEPIPLPPAEDYPTPDYQYDAFISYSTRTDYNRARKIEAFLESFHRTPAPAGVTLRRLQICRDGSDFTLPVRRGAVPLEQSDPVWSIIGPALRKSRYLLVLCSPGTLDSDWVSKEIGWFLEYRGAEWILPVVTEAADPGANPTECFPAAMIAAGIHQRIYYDLRALGQTAGASKVRNYEDELVRLASALLDWRADKYGPLAAIWEREQRRRSRRQKIIAAAVLSILLALGGVAVWRSLVASNEARAAESQRLAARALSLLENDPEEGLRVAVQAIGVSPTEQAGNALRQALLAFRLRNTLAISGGEHVIAISPDGEMLLSGSSNSASLFALNTVERLQSKKQWGVAAGVSQATFSPDGKFIAILRPDHEVQVLETIGGRQTAAILNMTAPLALDSSGSLVVTANDENAEVRDVTSGRVLTVLRTPKGKSANTVAVDGRPLGAEFSGDSRLIVTADDAGLARIWNAHSGVLQRTLSGHSSSVLHAEFSSDGSMVVTTSQDGTARVWETAGGQLLAELKGHTGPVTRAAFSRDGEFVVTASADGTARVWLTDTGESVAVLGPHRHPVLQAVFTPDGRYVVTAVENGQIRLWDANTGRSELTLSGHDDQVTNAAFSLSGKLVVTSCRDGKARIWEASTGRELAELEAYKGVSWMARFSPDEQLVATAGADGVVRLWEWQSRRIAREFKGHEGAVFSVDFSPDGEHLLTSGADGTARIWGVRSGAMDMILSGHAGPVSSAEYSPDGASVVTAGWDKVATVWDVKSGKPTVKLEGHRTGLTRASFSPDSKLVVTASLDNTARIWEAKTGTSLAELRTHSFPIYDAEFSPDGKYIVTAGENGIGIIWEVSTRRAAIVLRESEGFVNSAQFSRDGQYIVISSEDKAARIYVCEICMPLSSILDLAGQRLATTTETQ